MRLASMSLPLPTDQTFEWQGLGKLMGLLMAFLFWAMAGVAFAQTQTPTALEKTEETSEIKVVGSIRNLTGLVSLQSAEGKNRFANVGSKLYVGDIINTQKKSTAVLTFVDNTQVALRPSTQFVVEDFEYQPENPIADRADFKLVKGGLRTLTGLIGKRSTNDAFQMRSETATIGIRGTDFAVRVCKSNDCEKLAASERASTTETNTSTVGAAGRVSQVFGQFTAVSPAGEKRELTRGSAVFTGDTVSVSKDGFAVLVMADSSRMTLPSDSTMEISAFDYVPSAPKTSVASFKLLTGAVRAVTGAIGKAQPKNVSFSTQTATIGIRGTEINFGVVPPGAPPPAVPGDVVLQVLSGNVVFTNASGQSITLGAGQFATISGAGIPQLLANPINIQQFIGQQNPGPSPVPQKGGPTDSFDDLSSTSSNELASQGEGDSLLVAVYDGKVVVSNKSDQPPLEVDRGQGAFIQFGVTNQPTLLQAPPQVLTDDTTLSAPPFQAPQCAP